MEFIVSVPWDISILISIKVVLAYIPTDNVRGFLFHPRPPPYLLFLNFLMIGIVSGVRWNSVFFKFAFPYCLDGTGLSEQKAGVGETMLGNLQNKHLISTPKKGFQGRDYILDFKNLLGDPVISITKSFPSCNCIFISLNYSHKASTDLCQLGGCLEVIPN